MKKHSPNFFENLQEADNAKNNRATTFFWTVVLITILMLGLSVTKTKAQDSIKIKGSERILFGTVIDYGEALQIRTADTIPVVMMVSDTTIERNSGLKDSGVFVFSLKECPFYTIYGYEVTTIVPILFESGQRFYPGMPTTEKKTIYLNHKKQPLPDRIIVWMAIRRNEK